MQVTEFLLPRAVRVHDGLDVDDVAARFEIFEALHHTMRICNPMSPADLERVVGLLEVKDGHSVLDIACGYGELLIRLAQRAAITGIGLDLSPWMIRTACEEAATRVPEARLEWELGEAKHAYEDERFDRVLCLGASWIWLGLNGTLNALAQRTKPGGVVAVGDMHTRTGVDPADVVSSHGRVDSLSYQEALFADHGLELIERVATEDASWDDYLRRTHEGAAAWLVAHPGKRAERYVAEQRQWQANHKQDREVLTWSVWIARRR